MTKALILCTNARNDFQRFGVPQLVCLVRQLIQVRAAPSTIKTGSRRIGSPVIPGSPYGIRTRDLRLERAVSLAARRRGLMAGDPGFEPGLTDSESAVLPLNESPEIP